MPGKVKVKIVAGRNLPIMDRSNDTTDAYVEVKLGSTTFKTDVCRKSLNPLWNSEWFRFEMDDLELQDEPLQIRLMDHDTYSANDAIGKVYLDLNPLLLTSSKGKDSTGRLIAGWIPVYDTMHGIRGEVNLLVKVELFSDVNKFRQSSCGVMFFFTQAVPEGYVAHSIHGFVEELVVNDDPEYQWIDKIRTPRASNEARQTLFSKLSGEVQRRVGLKALELGGNAVIGYRQCFDLEGESGIVVRGIGTAVSLVKQYDSQLSPSGVDSGVASREFQAVDGGLPLSFHPWHLSKTRKPNCKGYWAPSSSCMPEYAVCSRDVSEALKLNHFARAPASDPIHLVSPYRIPPVTSLERRVSPTNLNTFSSFKKRPPQDCLSHNPFSNTYTSVNYHDANSKLVSPDPFLAKAATNEINNRESVSSLSVFDDESKINGSDDSDDNNSNVFRKDRRFPTFLTKRSVRAATSKGRYSKTSLIKHAHHSFTEDVRSVALSKRRESLRSDIFKFFRKAKMTSHRKCDTGLISKESDSAQNTYVTDRKNSLQRCNSDSYSLDQTSLDSFPSAQSDIVFDYSEGDTDCNSYESDSLKPSASPTSILKITDSSNPTDGCGLEKVQPQCEKPSALPCSSCETSIACCKSSVLNVEDLDSLLLTCKNCSCSRNVDKICLEKCLCTSKQLQEIEKDELDNSDRLIHCNTVISEESRYTNDSSQDLNVGEGKEKSRSEIQENQILEACQIDGHGQEASVGNTSTVSHAFSQIPVKNHGILVQHAESSHIERLKQSSVQLPNKCTTAYVEEGNRTDFLDTTSAGIKCKKYQCTQKSDIVAPRSILNIRSTPKAYILASRSRFLALSQPNAANIANRNCSDECSNPSSSLHAKKYAKDSGNYCRQIPIVGLEHVIANKTTKLALHSGGCRYLGSTEPMLPDTKSLSYEPCDKTGADLRSTPVPSTCVDLRLSSCKPTSSTNLSSSTSASAKNITISNIGIPCNFKTSDNSTTSQPTEVVYPGKTGMINGNKETSVGAPVNRRLSDSDLSSVPKTQAAATTMTTVIASGSHGKTLTFAPIPHRRLTTGDHFDMLEYPFITLNQFPPGFVQHLGGTVSARSVKLLERISNLDEPESRDSWWTEIRMEIRSHARSIGCNVVLGYEEHTTMCDDVCVLSASGTAAIVSYTPAENCDSVTAPGLKTAAANDTLCPCVRMDRDKIQGGKFEHLHGCPKCIPKNRHSSSDSAELNCQICHIPYNEGSVPFPVSMTRCLLCKRGKVPDILLSTIDLPNTLPTCGKSCLIQAQVFRPKKDCKGEVSAKEVSDSLPFLEYELHRRLINKLKVRGMNAIFALQVQICLGEKLMVGLATGTAVFVSSLPPPCVPKISAGNLKTDSQKVAQFQKVVQEAYDRNREVYNLKQTTPSLSTNGNQSVSSDGEDSDEDLPDIDLGSGNKDTYVLEVDDAEDIDIIQVLIDPSPELGFYMNNINFLHGFEDRAVISQQMFTKVWRCRISPLITLRQFTNYFDKLLQAVTFKLRRISPCVLSKLRYRVELPEQDEMQLSIIGLAIRLDERAKLSTLEADLEQTKIKDCDTGIVVPRTTITEPVMTVSVTSSMSESMSTHAGGPNSGAMSCSPSSGTVNLTATSKHKHPGKMNVRPKCIELTPLPHIPGRKIDKYLGNLNFFFIRETTSIRENGGLSGFVHSFVAEVLAIVRAHVAALGGNAMVSYFMTELSLLHNPHKNQGQCLVNVGGDVVVVSSISSLNESL